MALPSFRKMAFYGAFVVAAILLTVIVFEGWTMVSIVAQNLFMIVVGVVFLGLVILVIWTLLNKPEEKPTIAWKRKLANSAKVSVTKHIKGHRLWAQGDQKHAPHCLGTITGWTSLMHEYITPKLDNKKNQVYDKNKMPVMVPLLYNMDEKGIVTQPDGTLGEVIMHKKGEVKTWNESIFEISTGGFFSSPLYFRVPERMHSDLSGDVFVNCISFVQKGEYMYPNTIYDQREVELMSRDEIRTESFYGLLDDIKLGVKKGMDSNPQHRMHMEAKKLLEAPVEGGQ